VVIALVAIPVSLSLHHVIRTRSLSYKSSSSASSSSAITITIYGNFLHIERLINLLKDYDVMEFDLKKKIDICNL
jgi:hypothetical protein